MGLSLVIIIGITNLALGLFVLLRDPKVLFARVFFITGILISTWIAMSYLTESRALSLDTNNVANTLSFVFGYAAILGILAFTYVFPVRRSIAKLEAALLVITSVIVIGLSFTPLIAGVVTLDNDGLHFSIGELISVYIIAFIGVVSLLIKNLLRLPKRLDANRRVQAHMLLFAFSISAAIAIIFNAVIPAISASWHTTQFGPLSSVLLNLLIVYTIARHGLFDVRLAVVRTVAYVLALLTLAGVYYLIALAISELFLSDSSLVQPVGIALALVLAFIFQPVRHFFDQLTNKLFYKENYNIDDFFGTLNRLLSSTQNLRHLLERSAGIIAQTLKAEQTFFLVYKTNTHRHLLAGTNGHTKLAAQDVLRLEEYSHTHPGLIIRSMLDDNRPLNRLLMSYKLELVMPLRREDTLIGYLCLGEHKTSNYNTRDIKVLQAISDELIIAIENALSVQEVKDLNATLQQRISEATKELRTSNAQLQRLDEAKDEFISMASHQLRTPLTSIKGYISMLIEGDVGKVTGDQKHLLDEAFISSERMVRLIGDFLNVSRLQTGKFTVEKQPVDLAKVVAQEIESLLPNATARKLKFTYKQPKNFPALNLDESKIRQVIMNFADNAIYYSKEKTTIKIDLKFDKTAVEFTVKDSGIGVPEKEKENLFGKFFRATNARKQRPDGTGVGLFLAKKVIDAHDGQVIFESTEGKGSTFGFRLPLAKSAVRNSKKLDDKPSNTDHDSRGNKDGSSDPLVVKPPLSHS